MVIMKWDWDRATELAQIFTAIAGIATAVAAFIACGITHRYGKQTLLDAKESRISQSKPHLGFVLDSVAGNIKQMEYHRYMFGPEVVGIIRNYGLGPAINICCRWRFVDVDDVSAESIRSNENSSVVYPRNLMPGETATVWNVPSLPWHSLHEKFEATGEIVIEYEDRSGVKRSPVT